ncbi:unnamed protein product [Prorocentrum cordatum]|uniref:3-deoxy-7-phosphoheptulonate synthase n=1 Tax=Prorocentrum cordatum TaxID=2364126 RepID=A0ABN9R7W4_9DINO|nr:unnamed protein product [Polarella glacialis]
MFFCSTLFCHEELSGSGCSAPPRSYLRVPPLLMYSRSSAPVPPEARLPAFPVVTSLSAAPSMDSIPALGSMLPDRPVELWRATAKNESPIQHAIAEIPGL